MDEDKFLKLRERLAGYLHNQWWLWSKEITMTEKISKERLIRWKLYWTEYKNLVEDAKNLDRDRADEIIAILKEFGLL